MRRSLVATGLCAVVLAAVSQPGMTAERGADIRNAAASDLSAAKKKKQRIVEQREAAPALAARRGWFDPSLGPDGRPYRNPYPPGTCSIDQGYGRFGNCDFHD